MRSFVCFGLLMACLLGRLPQMASGAPRRGGQREALDLRSNLGRATQHRYGQVYQSLQVWLGASGYPSMAVLAIQDVGMVSEISTSYLHELRNQGRPYSMGPHTLAAVHHCHRRLQRQLRAAWAAVRTWSFAEPGELRSPIPLLVSG